MPPLLVLPVALLAAYLLGSANFAIPIARVVRGVDIRAVGNRNPGAVNVFHCVGKGWGVLVGFLDGCKSVVPMVLARWLAFPADDLWDPLAVAAVGVAAILGHVRPVFHRFQGGKGAGTVLGAFLFLVPLEVLVAFALGIGVVAVFLRHVAYRWGRWVPIVAITLTPFVALSARLLPLPDPPGWGHVAGAALLSLCTLSLNLGFMRNRLSEARDRQA